MQVNAAYQVPLQFRIVRPVLKSLFRTLFLILSRVEILGAENVLLGKPYVVGLAGHPAADQAWQGGHEAEVLLVANAPRLGCLRS